MFKSTIQILQTKQDEEWFVEEGMTWMKFYEQMNKQLIVEWLCPFMASWNFKQKTSLTRSKPYDLDAWTTSMEHARPPYAHIVL
jgi:hypothetical protein